MDVTRLQQMKPQGRKIVAVVAYDYQMAQIVDRAGVDIVSVGDSVGVNCWGHASQLDVTVDQMVLVCQAVRRAVKHALVSCDMPFGPLQDSVESAIRAAGRLAEEGGADMVKVDGAVSCPEAVGAIARTGVPVWAQFGLTPHTLGSRGADAPSTSDSAAGSVEAAQDRFVAEAKLLEQAGASMLDFTHSGPLAGPAVVRSVSIPVLGGLGGGPWLDGRVRSAFAAIGYAAAALDDAKPRYANVAEIVFAAIKDLSDDIRSGRQLRG